MSPRRNRPGRGRPARGRPAVVPLDPEQVRRGVDTVELWRDEPWQVRHIPGPAAVKPYRCPGCDQLIGPGVPHLVSWPLEPLAGGPGESQRRHWHTACWRARDRRAPGR